MMAVCKQIAGVCSEHSTKHFVEEMAQLDILLKQWTLINQVYIVVLDEIMTDKPSSQQQQQHQTSTESVCLKDLGGVNSADLSPFPVSNNN